MLKSWKKIAFQLIILIVLIMQISLNSVLAEEVSSTNSNNSSLPNTENSNSIERIRTIPKTEDNSRVTPTKERQVTPNAKSSRAKSSRPIDPYEKYYDAIQKFDAEFYGEDG